MADDRAVRTESWRAIEAFTHQSCSCLGTKSLVMRVPMDVGAAEWAVKRRDEASESLTVMSVVFRAYRARLCREWEFIINEKDFVSSPTNAFHPIQSNVIHFRLQNDLAKSPEHPVSSQSDSPAVAPFPWPKTMRQSGKP